MKVLHQDRGQGLVKLRVDTLDDLWHLSHLIQAEDLVRGVTQRRLDERQDMVRDTATERVTMTLGVRVESVEFHEHSQRLRVLGTIEQAPEDVNAGGHHTISIGEHDWVEILKPGGWPGHQLDRVQEAVEATHEPRVTIVAMDDDEATVAVLYQFGPRELATKVRTGGGKQYDGQGGGPGEFYGEVRHVLETSAPEDCPVVVCGPGFARENFLKFLGEHPVDRVGAVVTEPTSHTGMHGVQEAIKRGVVNRVAEKSRISQETQAVEALLERIATDGLATYGREQVRRALNMGAVEQLIVVDELVRDGEVDRLLELARQTGSEVLVVSQGHDAGETLANLTGIGALLRYKPG